MTKKKNKKPRASKASLTLKYVVLFVLAGVAIMIPMSRQNSQDNNSLPTLAVLPTEALSSELTLVSAIASDIEPSATPLSTITPNSIPTETPLPIATATITNTLLPTATITNTVEPTITPNKTRQELAQSLEVAMDDVQGVTSVEMVSVLLVATGNDIAYAEITVSSGFNHPGTADSLRQVAYTTLASSDIDFSVILTDGRTASIDYVWNNRTNSWKTTVLQSFAPTSVPAPTIAVQSRPTANTQYTCNCSKTCPAMISCEEAYYQLNTCGCDRRDGDNDGVPCETICPGG